MKAIKSFSDEVMSIDQEILRGVLENHILKKKISLGKMFNGQLVETIGGKTLRVFVYRTVRHLFTIWALEFTAACML